jgi:hypothetical protein
MTFMGNAITAYHRDRDKPGFVYVIECKYWFAWGIIKFAREYALVVPKDEAAKMIMTLECITKLGVK